MNTFEETRGNCLGGHDLGVAKVLTSQPVLVTKIPRFQLRISLISRENRKYRISSRDNNLAGFFYSDATSFKGVAVCDISFSRNFSPSPAFYVISNNI